MPSQSRRQYVTVEVKPENVSSSKAKLTPSSPGSPKAVHFATLEKAKPRALTPTEAWSLYHFEAHAGQCRDCYGPLEVHQQGRRLCATGHGLAQDVAEHVYRQDGVVYSRKKDNHKLVRVDMPHNYPQLSQLLKTMDRAIRSAPRTVPIVSYDRTYPVSARRTAPEANDAYEDERAEVVIEPAVTTPSRHKSKQKSTRYTTVVLEEDVEATTTLRKERRGSLYYDDMQRQRKEAYKVEIREPERSKESRRRERPKSGFWL
ncbi:hypothetical protein LTR36_006458 [Oleoguttula mirabilis]|uniref:Uncharacterized protein n=1 Tax=Oleoguttula mirabilis TaxID=1507867 RepID=A0AAV9JUW3_9PEZI|nr:hypothetical protein LTR36_006458 [Oleoguttula mirabilis]